VERTGSVAGEENRTLDGFVAAASNRLSCCSCAGSVSDVWNLLLRFYSSICVPKKAVNDISSLEIL
jgi:hypothetical protein